ncbi:2-hydroxy-3-keto-5-methylthiopentenyl-1-phosphatephosphatase related protein [hydrothermal vent metagenome]|uniref:2-hydroxy-3-keto-5-methylthiopentenyl-1-phosphate phosphatase related protein n=1 Tax=hydrothermal vent metagenome TaxID=652676 RepID=A0A3B1DD75_9ZZZZ
MTDQTIKIFVDFDGTIMKNDVGDHLFMEFGNLDVINEIADRWIAGEISSATFWLELFDTLPEVDKSDMDTFLDTMEMDEGFRDFLQLCDKHSNIEMIILSDGLDYYIDHIFSNHNLNHLKVFTNKLHFMENNKMVPSFPYMDEECKICANCKRNHILDNSRDDDITIFIGDGLSDTCPVQYVDYIFAKRDLLKFCEKNRISYYPFNNFYDVNARLEKLFGKRRLKKRHQAELKRKAVYSLG